MNQERAWLFLQAGDFRNADREVSTALKAAAAFYPAETTGGLLSTPIGTEALAEAPWSSMTRSVAL